VVIQDELRSIEDLAGKNHDAAISLLDSLSDPELRSLALAAIARGWAKSDPKAAGAWVTKLEPENDSISAALGLIPAWVAESPEFVWSRAATGFSDPARILHVRAMALEAISETNPSEAIQFAESVGNDPELLMGIARGWAFKDEAAAKEWISRITDPELVKLLMRQISPL
jgi:hypothetical protein